jgi:glycosyltransferase involved in cell wall biosynthesis
MRYPASFRRRLELNGHKNTPGRQFLPGTSELEKQSDMSQVSVIIPVYNTAPYLRRCLDSVCGQTLRDMEIICVNDGSTDDSADILRRYENADRRVKSVEHQHNRGPAAARNTGMRAARGEYLSFLDSDDWIDQGYLQALADAAERENVSVVMNTNIVEELANGNSKQFLPENFVEHIGANTTGHVSFLRNAGNFTYSSCCNIYNHQFLYSVNARFPEGLHYDDNFFHMTVFVHLDTLYLINSPSYHYCRRVDSVCGQARTGLNSYDIIQIYDMIFEYFKDNNFLDRCKLNFFELSYYINLFTDKNYGFNKVKKLFLKISNDIILRSFLYYEKDLAFFDRVVTSDSYDDFQEKISKKDDKAKNVSNENNVSKNSILTTLRNNIKKKAHVAA